MSGTELKAPDERWQGWCYRIAGMCDNVPVGSDRRMAFASWCEFLLLPRIASPVSRVHVWGGGSSLRS